MHLEFNLADLPSSSPWIAEVCKSQNKFYWKPISQAEIKMTSATINNFAIITLEVKVGCVLSEVNYWHPQEINIRQLIFLKAGDYKNTIARMGKLKLISMATKELRR